MSRMPIRARMTMAFALAMAVVLIAVGGFVYTRLQSDLDESIDTTLRVRADGVAAAVDAAGRRARLPGDGAEPEEGFVQLLARDGRLVATSGGTRSAALTPDESGAATRAAIVRERKVEGVDGTTRLRAQPARGGTLVVVAGVSLEDRDETLRSLLASFAVGGPVAILLASGLGYLLAGAGLAPIEAMRRRAEHVSLAHGGERLPLPAARDEVWRLGSTLNEMLARLEASFHRERRFVADAGHELRTPLAVLKAELDAALRRATDPDVRASLSASLEETDHLVQLADDLLLIARASDDGGLPVQREEVELRLLLEQARDRFVDRARSHGRDITVDAPEGVRASLDPLRLRQALGNVIDNALRYGEGDIALTARESGAVIELAVADEGPGFPPELRERAFERFTRGDEGRSRGGGTGLGLAIVRAIAEAHGGTATLAESGAAVRLRFPALSGSRRTEPGHRAGTQ